MKMNNSQQHPTTTDNSKDETDDRIGTQGPPTCGGCSGQIFDSIVMRFGGRSWHSVCLRCVVCQQELGSCAFSKEKRIYCRTDFARMFGAKCCSCQEVIAPSEAVHVTNDNIYHVACFCCVVCGSRVEAGDCFYLREDQKLLCKADYHDLVSNACSVRSDSDSDESGGSGRRQRTCIDNRQLRMLMQAYGENRRPSRQIYQQLSRDAGLEPRVVKVWFQNQRAKERRLEGTDHPPSAQPQQERNLQTGTAPRPVEDRQPSSRMTSSEDISYHNAAPVAMFPQLDFMLPQSMPPNINLSSSDIKNGEVLLSADHSHLMRKIAFQGEGTRQPACFALY